MGYRDCLERVTRNYDLQAEKEKDLKKLMPFKPLGSRPRQVDGDVEEETPSGAPDGEQHKEAA